ncbi:MAG: mannose-1-phosphate guanylyltransferase/mannose-6-phosphate isomerase [Rhodospirillales bacterium]|uniref:mannose-1-phosphate guanylyltransferase/mannose-6-phosphate isomerase n=1 Tax=Accumulibacter sp. TaxID=2053492 RepID=UPI001DC6C024|nr:mannose-1-phosphate guanylyltransferase/mannose-6-phosphate isomerase [Accumulibacter sp.]MBX3517708.1 mannose-1-phosphate guanylyltransferase/mannose-6-phosphate isomerase [Rhodospirillales bacterium]MCM8627109.1 mannose-1-phosphate guanylyltransferase/mannose-6-phosphate isomerase [Accumulibacter sp.]
MIRRITPVVLSGGAGTRLWPLSRALRPKQLLPLISEKSLFQETIGRTLGSAFAPPLVICNEDHRFMIAEQLRELEVRPETIILEPTGRNTAPAVAVAALFLQRTQPDGVMLVMPSDHVVGDAAAFIRVAEIAADAAETGALVSFGIVPTRPETGYGYLCRGEPVAGIEGCFHMGTFVEKPDIETAGRYLADHRYYWNSGMFVLPIAGILAEMERLCPDLLDACRDALAQATSDLDFCRLAREPFNAAPSISIDYAVMERTDRGALVPADMQWSDVGSWSALWEIGGRDADGNVILGDVVTMDARNCYIRSEHRLVAAVAVEDLVVVDTDDVILVARMDRDQDVKKVVEVIARAGRNEHLLPRQVFRPWGWYRSLHEGNRFQVKEIVVNPGERLSAQMHHHRAEHWIVVTGTAKVSKGNETFYITEDQSTYIPHATRHSLENPGKIPLKMIEVQSGAYLGEDDIIRFEDLYGRVPTEKPTLELAKTAEPS